MSAARTAPLPARGRPAPLLTLLPVVDAAPPPPKPKPIKPKQPAPSLPPAAKAQQAHRDALTAAQARRDQALAAGDTRGMLHAEAGQWRLLSPAEERALGRQMRGADPRVAKAARDILVERNVRLVESIAGRLARGARMEVGDLIGAGMLGLMRAVEKFDPERGLAFSTMATWWIRQAILRYQDDYEAAIRAPSYLRHRDRRARRMTSILAAEYERAPTDEEVAAALNAEPFATRGRSHGGARTPVTAQGLREARTALRGVLSLDAPLPHTRLASWGSQGAQDLADGYHALADERAGDAQLDVERASAREHLFALIRALYEARRLDPRDLAILSSRFIHGRSLRETAVGLGISGERVRQIERDVLRTLRAAFAEQGVVSMADMVGSGVREAD